MWPVRRIPYTIYFLFHLCRSESRVHIPQARTAGLSIERAVAAGAARTSAARPVGWECVRSQVASGVCCVVWKYDSGIAGIL